MADKTKTKRALLAQQEQLMARAADRIQQLEAQNVQMQQFASSLRPLIAALLIRMKAADGVTITPEEVQATEGLNVNMVPGEDGAVIVSLLPSPNPRQRLT